MIEGNDAKENTAIEQTSIATEESTAVEKPTAEVETVAIEENSEISYTSNKVSIAIDYNKLAEAIVKAQRLTTNENVVQKDGHINRIASVFSHTVSIIEYILCAIMLTALVLSIEKMDWSNAYTGIGNLVVLSLSALITAVTGIVGYWTWQVGKRIKDELDRNYAVAVFSCLAAFAGFIIAGISLLLMAR